MEFNKENIRATITKIPIPKQPLPAIPKHLLKPVPMMKRNPLQTLMHSNSVPSSSNAQHLAEKPSKRRESLKIDTRHVTVRSKHDDLDWNHQAIKRPSENVIYISDNEDETSGARENQYFNGNDQRSCLGDSRLAVTPVLEHKGVRNIKKSLKRPHSRELQGLSPIHPVREDRIVDERVKRRLKFNDSLAGALQPPDLMKRLHMICVRDYTEDMFEYLLTVEKKPYGVPKISSVRRACVINWLLKVNGPDGNPAIIQSACWYLDSILGISLVPVAKLQLVATACYWIARKLHGPGLAATKLVRCSNKAFTVEGLMNTEKAVMERLEFPSQPVIPQEFITYLSWWCDSDHPGEIEVAATFICMSGLMVNKALCEEYPSVIAVASVRNALILVGKSNLINRLQMSPIFQHTQKKNEMLELISTILHRAVRLVWDPVYEYKAPLEYYGLPLYCRPS